MSNTPLTIADLKHLCRSCMDKHNRTFNLFSDRCSNGDPYEKVLMECTSLQASHDDRLPSHICFKCAAYLESFVVFRGKCIESDVTLRGVVSSDRSNDIELIDLNSDAESNDECVIIERAPHVATTGAAPAVDSTTTRPEPPGQRAGDFGMYYSLQEQIDIKDDDPYDIVLLEPNERASGGPVVVADRPETNGRPSEDELDVDPPETKERLFEDPLDVDLSETNEHPPEDPLDVDPPETNDRSPEDPLDDGRPDSDERSSEGSIDTRRSKTETASPKDPPSIVSRRSKTETASPKDPPSIVSRKLYLCELCPKTYLREISLYRHTRDHANKKPFECEYCKKVFFIKAQFVVHVRSHTGEKPFPCSVCSSRFSAKAQLDRHMYQHGKKKPFVCDLCPKTYYRRQHIAVHRRTHTGERPFVCPVCEKTFTSNRQLVVHSYLHAGKPMVCDRCGKSFVSRSRLARHVAAWHRPSDPPEPVASTSGRENPPTSTSGREDTTTSERLPRNDDPDSPSAPALITDIKDLPGDRTFRCDVCDRTFLRSINYAIHMDKHAGKRPYECDRCEMAYAKKFHLTRHMKSHAKPRIGSGRPVRTV